VETTRQCSSQRRACLIEDVVDAAHEDVVYLMARVKFLHPKSWVLAIDMKNN